MKMSDADRTQILNACQFLRDRGYSLVDSDEYSLELSDGVHTFAIAYGMRCDGEISWILTICKGGEIYVWTMKNRLQNHTKRNALR